MDDMCEDHHKKFAGKKHPDRMHRPDMSEAGWLPDHKRAAGHPAKHTAGKMPSQLNPDHGSHR
jgi:hypothetical protein